MMYQVVLSFVTGMFLGGIYTLLKLPLPAPTAFAGIMGILGVYAGYLVVFHFIK